jgi:hypothetical protein
MLDHDAGRLREFERNSGRGIEIQQIRVRKLLTLMHFPARPLIGWGVLQPAGLLMGILAVTQLAPAGVCRWFTANQFVPVMRDALEGRRDNTIVGGGVMERLFISSNRNSSEAPPDSRSEATTRG